MDFFEITPLRKKIADIIMSLENSFTIDTVVYILKNRGLIEYYEGTTEVSQMIRYMGSGDYRGVVREVRCGGFAVCSAAREEYQMGRLKFDIQFKPGSTADLHHKFLYIENKSQFEFMPESGYCGSGIIPNLNRIYPHEVIMVEDPYWHDLTLKTIANSKE